MSISSVKNFRRNLCKAIGHDFIKNVCTRCKKRLPVWFVGQVEFCGKMPVRKDVEVKTDPMAGDLNWDIELAGFKIFDGKNWIQCP